MKRKVFYDINMAHSYLVDTVIRYNEKPIYVHSIGYVNGPRAPFQLTFSYVGGPFIANLAQTDDPLLDMTPVPLGLLAYPGDGGKGWQRTAMVSRYPARKWKWGLSQINCDVRAVNNSFIPPPKAEVLLSAALRDTIMGKYPDYKTAFRLAKNTRESIFAFNRSFAVSSNKLYYKSLGEVGAAGASGPVLDDNHFYLQQVLDEDRTW